MYILQLHVRVNFALTSLEEQNQLCSYAGAKIDWELFLKCLKIKETIC